MRRTARRIAGVAVIMMALLALACAAIMANSARLYHDELTQRLNASIAMYVDAAAPLVRGGKIDDDQLSELSRHAMVVNPLARVYLLSTTGAVHGLHNRNVDMHPVLEFLRPGSGRPIYGTDPLDPTRRGVFSAAPVHEADRVAGYVYVLLGSERTETLAAAVASSRILSTALWTIAAVLLVGAACATLLIRSISRPLAAVHQRILAHAAAYATHSDEGATASQDELEAVSLAADTLAARAHEHVEMLRAGDRERRVLFEGLGHDLRTPLAAAMGYVESLLAEASQPAYRDLRPDLDVAHRHLQRLVRLVDQIFQLARLESPELHAQFGPLLLQELVGDIGAKHMGSPSGHRRLRLELAHDAPAVFGSCDLVETVVENLLDNAFRHTPAGSPVVLQVAACGAEVVVRVSDHGPGLPEDCIPQAGMPRRASLYSRKGLGLAIVDRSLARLGSQLRVHSIPGSGATLSFALVAQREDSVSFRGPASALVQSGPQSVTHHLEMQA